MLLRVCSILLALLVSQNLACQPFDYESSAPDEIGPDTALCLCEGEDVVTECPEGKVITWQSAEYKTLEDSTSQCISVGTTISPRHCQTKDSLRTVQKFCDGRQECQFSVNDTFFDGDPCYEAFNDFHLKVTYSCIDGSDIVPKTTNICENNNRHLPVNCLDGNIRIISASYKTDENNVNPCNRERTADSVVCTKDVKASVSNLCDGEQYCAFPQLRATFGDPCADTFKSYFEFEYSCDDVEPPTSTCPTDFTRFVPPEEDTVIVFWPDSPIFTDNSDVPVKVDCSSHNNTELRIGEISVDCTAVDDSGNNNSCSFLINVTRGFCDEEAGRSGTWPLTMAGAVAESKERCPVNTTGRNMGRFLRNCTYLNATVGSVWEEEIENDCGVGLNDLLNVNITSENVVKVSAKLAQATDREDVIFMDEDIQIVGDILEKIVDVGDGSEQVIQSVVDTVSNILYAPDTKVPSTSQPPSNSTTRIALALEEQVSLGLQQNDTVHAVAPNVAAQGFRVNSSVLQDETFDGRGFGILTDSETDLNNNSTRTLYKTSDMARYEPPAYIFLSNETVKTWSEKTSHLSFTFLAYRNDFLFPSAHVNETGRKVEGFILTANVEGDVLLNVDSLSNPVIIQHGTDLQGRDSRPFREPDCVYWDFDVNTNVWDWSSKGCTYVEDIIEEGSGVCSCTHLTNFAVLVYHGKEIIKSKALDIVSKIGCYISLVALIVTVITLILVRRLKMRNARNNRGMTAENDRGHNFLYLMIQLCISLIAVYVVFLAAIDRTVPVSGCTVAAALLHYFVLATMTSTAVQARYMYTKLVTPLKNPVGREPNLIVKATAVTYAFPAIIVAVSLGVDHRGTGFKAYNNEHYCFPKVGWIVYFAVLLPIAIVLIHNLLSAALIISKVICRSRFHDQRAGGNDSDKFELIERLRKSTAISCLLGLSWIFGFFAIDEATLTLQWLFTIFNSLQGLLIFIFFCLMSRDVRATIMSSTPCSSCRNYINTASSWTETSNISLSNTAGKDDDRV